MSYAARIIGANRKRAQATKIGTLSAFLAAFFVQTSSAAQVLWTLKDIQIDDGGIAAGSFIYDASRKIWIGDGSISEYCYGTMISWDMKTSGGVEPSLLLVVILPLVDAAPLPLKWISGASAALPLAVRALVKIN